MLKQYQTKAEVLAAREAHVVALKEYGHGATIAAGIAEYRYPMPTVTRPREVTISDGTTYWIVGGTMYYSRANVVGASAANTDSFLRYVAGNRSLTHADFIAMIELIQNPTETVEVDA